jgi:outer membrane lipoprotein-sorting protein
VAAKVNRLKSIQADFELVIEDRKENTRNSSTGNLLLKQNRYRIISEGSTIYYNGKTMWTHVPENNEVTVTEPDTREGDVFSNPYRILTCDSDFKYVCKADR